MRQLRYHFFKLILLVASTFVPVQLVMGSCDEVRLAQTPSETSRAKNQFVKVLLESIGYKVSIIEKSTERASIASLITAEADVYFDLPLPISAEAVRMPFRQGKVRALVNHDTPVKIHLYATEATKKQVQDVSELSYLADSKVHALFYKNGHDGVVPLLKSVFPQTQLDQHYIDIYASQNVRNTIKSMLDSPDIIFFILTEEEADGRLIRVSDKQGILGKTNGMNFTYTLARTSFVSECTNVTRLLERITFPDDSLKSAMNIQVGQTDSIKQYLLTNTAQHSAWLAKLLTIDGQNAFDASIKSLSAKGQ